MAQRSLPQDWGWRSSTSPGRHVGSSRLEVPKGRGPQGGTQSRQLSPGGLPAVPHLSPAPTLPTAHHPGSSEHSDLGPKTPTTWTQGPGHSQPAASTLHLWTDSAWRPCYRARGTDPAKPVTSGKARPRVSWVGGAVGGERNRGSRMLRAGRPCLGAGCGLETFRGRGPSRLRPPRAGETASRENEGRDSRLRPPPGSRSGGAHVPARLPPERAGLGASSGPGASRSRGPVARTHPGGWGGAGGRLRDSDPLGARRAHGLALRSAGPSPGRGAGQRGGQPAGGGGRAEPRGAGTRGHACAQRRARTEGGRAREEGRAEEEEEEEGLGDGAGGVGMWSGH